MNKIFKISLGFVFFKFSTHSWKQTNKRITSKENKCQSEQHSAICIFPSSQVATKNNSWSPTQP